MEELPADVKAFLLNHPFLQCTDGKKIKCTLNGHEFPCNLTELQAFTKGKKYEKLSTTAEFNYRQYEPHVVQSSKQPKQLFCRLTLRHLNRQPHHVLRHVNGKRFKKALEKYEECVELGIDYVPARQQRKKPRDPEEEASRGKTSTHAGTSSSDEDHSDSEDSMSDLYPPTMFSLKDEPEEVVEGEAAKEEDDFQTDDDEEMEVEVDTQVQQQKRKKEQGGGGLQKKFRNNRWKSGHKKPVKVPNGQ